MRSTSAVASPSDVPGSRLKLIDPDGNCAWCVTASGAVPRSKRATEDSGTCVPPGAPT